MNRHELAILIKQSKSLNHLSTSTVEKVLRTAEDIILNTIFSGGRVSFLGFGTFTSRIRKAHNKVSMLHGVRADLQIPAKHVLVFKAARGVAKPVEE